MKGNEKQNKKKIIAIINKCLAANLMPCNCNCNEEP